MKKLLILIVALICSAALFSQEVKENVYEVENNLIKVTMFHDNGQISQTGFYTLDGKLQGNWYSYDVEGNKLATANYENGKKVGKWTFWEKGVLREVDYTKNKISFVREFIDTNALATRDNQ
jgi:antitoxin component YwqK of YwqJK toxin-antitoxin module